jgi:hypothetical protein
MGVRRMGSTRRVAGLEIAQLRAHEMCGLRSFLDIAYLDADDEFQRLLYEHSLAPYVLACVPRRDVPGAIAEMSYRKKHSRAVRARLVDARTVIWNLGLRYCLQCVRADELRYGESYWHRVHQLPCTLSCREHGTWLYELIPEAMKGLLPVWPRMLVNTPHRCLGRGRVPNDVSRLAEADGIMLALGQIGFVGAEVRRTYLELAADHCGQRTRSPESVSALRKHLVACVRKMRLGGASREGLGLHSVDYRTFFDSDHRRTFTFRHVLLLTAAGVKFEDLQAAVEAHRFCTLNDTIQACGDRPCRRFVPGWQSDLAGLAAVTRGRVFGECSDCGFRAVASPEHGTVRVKRRGDRFLEFAQEIHDEGILSWADEAKLLGVSPVSLNNIWKISRKTRRVVSGQFLKPRKRVRQGDYSVSKSTPTMK